MPRQQNLFSDEISDTSPQQTESTTLQLTAHDNSLSRDQQRFNRLLKRIDNLRNQLAKIETLCDTHRPAYHLTLTPLRDRYQKLIRETVLWLHARLQRKGLSNALKRDTKIILCHLSQILALQGDEEMKNLHDQYSTESLAQKEESLQMDMREMMEAMLGKPLGEVENMDELLRASLDEILETQAAEAEQRQQKHARRKKPDSAQSKAETIRQEAETTLRKLFRQLASALHPDRETDPDERDRKTILMSEANAAYENRDLVSLLQIQLRVELTNKASIAQLAEEKIASLSLLLKQQINELESQLFTRRQSALHEFELAPFATLSTTTLTRNLKQTELSLTREIRMIELELQQIQDDKALKYWLKEQKRSIDMFGMHGPDDYF